MPQFYKKISQGHRENRISSVEENSELPIIDNY
jgi:hypothetical protein